MIRKIFKTGHSWAVSVSKQLLEDIGLKPGDEVAITSDKNNGRLIISPAKKQKQLALNIRPSLGKSKNK